MSDNAPTPTADQIAAFQRLDKILGNADQPFGDENWAEVRKWLPDALTNPQPALPTEPGHYLDAHNDVVELFEGEWYFNGARRSLDEVSGYAPLARLVPERFQVTREQIMGLLNELSAYSAGYKADAILDLLNDTPA